MTTPLLPDVELVIVDYLRRTGSRVVDLVDQRVYTVLPAKPRSGADDRFPLLRVYRFGGAPVRRLRHLDAAVLQLDAWGGSKADARRLVDTACAELADAHLATHTDAVVSAVDFGPLRYLPDETFEPAKPRYVCDVTVYLHP